MRTDIIDLLAQLVAETYHTEDLPEPPVHPTPVQYPNKVNLYFFCFGMLLTFLFDMQGVHKNPMYGENVRNYYSSLDNQFVHIKNEDEEYKV